MVYHAKTHSASWKGKRRDSFEVEKSQTVSGSIASFGKDTAKKAGEAFVDIGRGMFEQLLNAPEKNQETTHNKPELEERPKIRLEGGTLFSFQKVEDQRQINEIKELIKQIKKEIEMIKKADKALISEVKDIEKLTIDSLSEKPGIYHIRVFEIFLNILRHIRARIGESKTWMDALMSKKAKRGSLFAVRAKKKGTQYSLSQELATSRSIQ